MLIDTRIPPPSPDRAAWEPNWRLCGWVALTVLAFVVANAVGGLAGYVVVLVGIVAACRAVCVLTPSLDGLREYRQ